MLLNRTDADEKQKTRTQLLKIMIAADPVGLELAVTAAFLAANKVREPWHEVKVRKQDKASAEAIKLDKNLYRQIAKVKTPIALPAI